MCVPIRHFGWLQKILFVSLLPMAIPVASVSLLWKVLFNGQGLSNHFLTFFSLQKIDWLNTQASFSVLVSSYIWRNLGYDIVLWLAGLSGISVSLYEAAKVDGANSWKCFIRQRFWKGSLVT